MPTQHTLNVSLTPELVAYVAGLVATGRYSSSSEVIRAALRSLQREEPNSAAAAGAPELKAKNKGGPR